ncbi:MAG: pesticidal protein Cry1Ba [Burkholderiales bacterium RIFCSPLOWO2_12_FULL_64_99]|nr:MAG: pesticidal protein Cry1Ba [Burkholderiales bacterium RIFCSPHIGHO2_12_FULL_63_20]OGB65149.1 MAG: pesticidal protein Cry1Ba [Burkholderiales bacterium RIFCSPLOWO2_12_FULL_64_99]
MPAHTSTWQRARRPVLSVLLALAWLTLQQSLDLGNVLTACVLGWGLPRLLGGFLGPAAQPRSVARALRLGLSVLWDIIVSNITVARLVLNPRSVPHPAWVKVPLTLTQPTAQALLASIITMTPGTVSAIVDEEGGCIWVHALDCDDPAAVATDIDRRYQQPLMEILG